MIANETTTYKIVLVGEYSTGKSALHKRLLKDEFDSS
jgi:GTPase SAR1 family protein